MPRGPSTEPPPRRCRPRMSGRVGVYRVFLDAAPAPAAGVLVAVAVAVCDRSRSAMKSSKKAAK